ncbi:MAG: hypothetical protein R3191_06075 [Anaerolineales bacterium]|nr:hypothetical protein [Anaerolineales bacterium]
MSDAENIETSSQSSNGQILFLGGLFGALTGIGIAYVLTQRAERQGGEIQMSTGEGLRLGLLILGTVRQVADLALPDSEE